MDFGKLEVGMLPNTPSRHDAHEHNEQGTFGAIYDIDWPEAPHAALGIA